MNNWYKYILLTGLIVIVATSAVSAEKGKKKTTVFRLEYFKNNDQTEALVATLRFKEKSYVPLSNGVVFFYSVDDTSKVLLVKIETDENGEAIFAIDDNPKIFKDSLGFMTFEVEYSGSASLKASHKKITIKQANLEMSFFQKDTINFIETSLSEIGPDGENIPISNVEILFYIKGTFSLLKFGEGTSDENGNVSIPFPVEMPGDSLGKLIIVTKVEEHDDLGTIETKGDINWGIPVPILAGKHRGLGDTDAPLWMVYTLITLLSAVWFHYIYVIYLMLKIRIGKRLRDVRIKL